MLGYNDILEEVEMPNLFEEDKIYDFTYNRSHRSVWCVVVCLKAAHNSNA
jgi:hypothetical protein